MGVGVGACAVTGHLPVSTRSRLRVIQRGVAAADRRGHVSPSPRWSVSVPGVTDMKRRRFRVNTADS